MPQILPGLSGFFRTISLGELGTDQPKFGSCFTGLQQSVSFAIGDEPTRLNIDFTGFNHVMSELLREADGLPTLVGNVNHSGAIRNDVTGVTYGGWSGEYQSRQFPGTEKTILRRVSTNAVVIESFVLVRRSGSLALWQYFVCGGSWETIVAGQVLTLPNRASAGGTLSGILASTSGQCTVRKP